VPGTADRSRDCQRTARTEWHRSRRLRISQGPAERLDPYIMSILVGEVVRIKGLLSRPALNGAHAVVIAAATDEEAADLQRKQRLKVRTKIASETLSVGIAKVARVEADAGLDDDAIFSTPYFSVERVDGRGYAWRARRKISRGLRCFARSRCLCTR
jgi:hypothetical protein